MGADDESDVSSVHLSDDADKPNTEQEDAEANNLANADILTKYKAAAEIANNVLRDLIASATPGTAALALCQKGDDAVADAVAKVYNAKKAGKAVDKGSAFPTCVSLNNCIGHYSPLASEADVTLAEGDLVKIDLGVHIDGYIAIVAASVVCSAAPADAEAAPVTGRKADAMLAAHTAGECAHRMYKEGATNEEVTAMIQAVAEAYDCKPVEGVFSHQMKKHVIDANKCIATRANPEVKTAPCTLALGDVFGFDIAISTGDGTPKQSGWRTTVFKRDLENKYSLKMKASRTFFSEVNARFPTLPFTLRAGDERTWRMGIVECIRHSLFTEYPVLEEKADEYVAHLKFTVALLPSGKTVRLTAGPSPNAVSEHEIKDEKILELLKQSVEIKKKPSKKKKKKGGGGGGGVGEDA